MTVLTRWNSLGIKVQILVLSSSAALLAVTLMGLSAGFQSGKSSEVAEGVLKAEVRKSLSEAAHSGALAVRSQAALLELKVDGHLNAFQRDIREAGGLQLASEIASWKAVNQFTKEASQVQLPALTLGGTPLPRSQSFKVMVPVLDRSASEHQGMVTVFQKMNRQGDMLRVATTVMNKEGKRGSGTYIPALNPDGKPNAVIKAVLSGKAFKGVAYVVDSWSQTEYRPLKDSRGQVIGMIFAGQKLANVPAIQEYIHEMHGLGDGHAFSVMAKGLQKGEYVFAPPGASEGQNSFEARTKQGEPWVASLVDKALASKEPVIQTLDLPAFGPAYVAAVYAPEWDWVIVKVSSAREVDASVAALGGTWKALQSMMLLGGAAAIILSGLISLAAAGALSKPLRTITAQARLIAEGKPASIVPSGSANEVGDLEKAFQAISESQSAMTSSFLQASQGDLVIHLGERSSEDELGRSMNQMVSSLSRLVSEVRDQAHDSEDIAHRLEGAADESRSSLDSFALAMKEMAAASQETAETASALSQSAGSLSGHLTESEASVKGLETTLAGVRQAAKDQQKGTLEAAAIAQKGGASVRETLEILDEIRTRTVEAADAVRELDRRQEQVGSFATSIQEIASQTNLLALNAAIEAARAGKHGAGFAVVADEVRKLTVRSSEASTQIMAVLNDIQTGAKNAVAAMEESQVTVEEGARSGHVARESLAEILGSIQQVQALAQGVMDQVDAIASSATSLRESILGMVLIGDSTSAAAEELTASSEEFSATMAHMNGDLGRQKEMVADVRTLAVKLLKASQKLSSSMAEFRTEEETVRRAA